MKLVECRKWFIRALDAATSRTTSRNLKDIKLRILPIATQRHYCKGDEDRPKPRRIKLPDLPADVKPDFSATTILPKTEFPNRIPEKQRKEHDLGLLSTLGFDKLYGLQRNWRRDQPEYILHDGPPYANGEVHLGHAVNKILKDITCRYKLLSGYRINYVPGWDCHGLPIELKALKNMSDSQSPLEIRDAARGVATSYITKQMKSFQRWGVMADWENSYKTFDPRYIKSQLQMFHQLYEKNLVYQDLKPVYWSPSSQTALAEAELEYRPNHESTAVYLSVELDVPFEKFAKIIGVNSRSEDNKARVNVVVWTTTPWSLPANKAIAYREKETYSVLYKTDLYSQNKDMREHYIVAKNVVEEFIGKTGGNFKHLLDFDGEHFKMFKYKHPWFENMLCEFYHGDFVTMDKGTGLVHIAPAHGQDDFLLALKHQLPIDCYVDDQGHFDSGLGNLRGLTAMTGGSMAVVEKLKSKILFEEKYSHSYPYDWRTKKPVVMKTSMQWFINTDKLKDTAAEYLKDVTIYPKNIQNGMLNQLMKRPYWCISRQRVWGVPIPVLYHKETGAPLVDKMVIDRICKILDDKGSMDFWWYIPVSELIMDPLEAEMYEKGRDIFDIWLDSGISWHTLGDKRADLYLEGQDQFTGWFQSSLLTSAALRPTAPFKNLLVHGFVVDGDNKKMSKSVGNVLSPTTITDGDKSSNRPAYGTDALRWWVATKGACDGSNLPISNQMLKNAEEKVQKLRSVLRYLLMFVDEATCEDMELDDVTYDEMEYIDQYMLGKLLDFQKDVTKEYEDFAYHRAMEKTHLFASQEISAKYISFIKDRLQYDQKDSASRRSVLFTMNQLYRTLIKALGPVLPFLTEESYSYYSEVPESFFKYAWFDSFEKSWENPEVRELIDLALDIRESVNQCIGNNNPKEVFVEIICSIENYEKLRLLLPFEKNTAAPHCKSSLCDILQVSGVDLRSEGYTKKTAFKRDLYGHSTAEGFSIGVSKSDYEKCARCKEFCCAPDNLSRICARCAGVLQNLDSKARMSDIEEHRNGDLPKEVEPEIEEPPRKVKDSS